MEKKLTRQDILLSFSFIFTLIVGVGAFFYGLQTGKEQTDAKYRTFMERLQEEQNQGNVAYHQQQLVSFYHTVLLPFRNFEQTWFEHLDTMESRNGTTDASALLKQIVRLAKEKYDEIEPSTIPEVSPLLIDAHRNYLKSLKLFSEAATRLQRRSGNGSLIAEQIRQDAYVLEAYGFALRAQREYYEAILEWNKASDPNVTGLEWLDRDQVTLDQWRQWNLNTKNVYICRILLAEGTLYGFYPQDISSRIDEMDATGSAGKLKLATIGQASQTLLSAGGVRAGDYLLLKEKLYKDETLPQLPFFFE
ncbi:hypothetical protein [Paenibacillus alkalitolerans]|uniref:hypothetical protein n=1 Tax=Paenibacillus alkalitolerans TaxID=2799335 RepID=UPI0018F38573|nr:hypothetical protein [Paenibacillus alkalitolerans]